MRGSSPVTARPGRALGAGVALCPCCPWDILPAMFSSEFTLLGTKSFERDLGIFLLPPNPAVKFQKMAFLSPTDHPRMHTCSGRYQVRLTPRDHWLTSPSSPPRTPTNGFKTPCISEMLAIISVLHGETGSPSSEPALRAEQWPGRESGADRQRPGLLSRARIVRGLLPAPPRHVALCCCSLAWCVCSPWVKLLFF